METAETTALILLIVAGASIFGYLITLTKVTDNVSALVLSITTTPWMVLLLVNIFLLIVGCFMETIAAITILVPVLLPLMEKIGVDPVHFGLIMPAHPAGGDGPLHPGPGVGNFLRAGNPCVPPLPDPTPGQPGPRHLLARHGDVPAEPVL
jgi:TRAP-type mannitol/chloroaromatic compound transport system permease large subunit